jgi:hypothetical protein
MNIYPNPADDAVYIIGIKGQVNVCDLSGELALSQQLTDWFNI